MIKGLNKRKYTVTCIKIYIVHINTYSCTINDVLTKVSVF